MFADTHSYDHPDDDYVLKGTLLSPLFAGVADTWRRIVRSRVSPGAHDRGVREVWILDVQQDDGQ